MLLLGAGPWSGGELAREIDRAGLQIKVTDSPGIPYDDYQTTTEYSFVRVETVDRFYREALAVLGEMIFAPTLGEEALAEAQKEAIPLAERRARSASEESQRLLRRAFYPRSRGAAPALGTAADLARSSVDDVRAFHERYFAPENLVVAIVTGLEPREVVAAARTALGRAPAGRAPGAHGAPCVAQRGSPAGAHRGARPRGDGDRARAVVDPGRQRLSRGARRRARPRGGEPPPVRSPRVRAARAPGARLCDRRSVRRARRSRLDRRRHGHPPENLPRAEAGLAAGIRGLAAADISAEK